MAGRPRHDGERYDCGTLKPPRTLRLPDVDQTTLTFQQAEAARRYMGTCQAAELAKAADSRVMAKQAFMQARAVLTPHEVGILDLVLIKGRTVGYVAQAAKRTPADMTRLYLTALTNLADHYEAVG